MTTHNIGRLVCVTQKTFGEWLHSRPDLNATFIAAMARGPVGARDMKPAQLLDLAWAQ